MAFLLVIDTALEQANVGFFVDGKCMGMLSNNDQKEHASFVQNAIDTLCKKYNIALQDIDGVAVVDGPGSYTGLRVGLASAKGICYALDKKLLLINTLEVMIRASIDSFHHEDYFYAALIDARRDDVFAGVYDHLGNPLIDQQALTIFPNSFEKFLSEKKLVLTGSGAEKTARILQNDNVIVDKNNYNAIMVNIIAQEKWNKNELSDVAYSQPNYLKPFYTTYNKAKSLT